MAKQLLKVPLILLTFQNPDRVGCGVAKIIDMDAAKGLTYAHGGPNRQIARSLEEAEQKIRTILRG